MKRRLDKGTTVSSTADRFNPGNRAGEGRFAGSSTQAVTRKTAMGAHGGIRGFMKKGLDGKGGPLSAYAWFYLTDEEQREYALWKDSPALSGNQSVIDEGYAPKNWRLLESGSTEDVAKRDVGLVGLHYLDFAQKYMNEGGAAKVIREWAEAHDIQSVLRGEIIRG